MAKRTIYKGRKKWTEEVKEPTKAKKEVKKD